MKQSIEARLDDLLQEPRALHASLIVCRVRHAMENVTQEIAPSRTVQVRHPELDRVVEGYVDETALPVDWRFLHNFACSFLYVLRCWERTGADEYRDAVKEGARVFLLAWATAIEHVQHLSRVSEPPIPWDKDSPHDKIAADRELALQGLLIDSGDRQRGRVVWTPSHVVQQREIWDA